MRSAPPDAEEPVSLDKMTKAQLLQYARDNGIEGVSSSMLKAEIYAAILEAI